MVTLQSRAGGTHRVLLGQANNCADLLMAPSANQL
jgi:hypothetical protein